MRISIVLAVVAATCLVGCSSGAGMPTYPVWPSLPGTDEVAAACGQRDNSCPPVEAVTIPGYRVPVYKTVNQPIYEERKTAVWGEKTVDVYQTRKVPVTISLPDSCSDCDNVVKLWDKEERVQVGTRRVPACIGYKTERVVVGHCPKQVQVGWRTVEETPDCPPAN